MAWMVTVTTLLFCNIAIAGANFLSRSDPDNAGLRTMKELLLILGTGVGVLSLVLLPIVYRVRTVPPPMFLAVIGACLAMAPLVALVIRNMH